MAKKKPCKDCEKKDNYGPLVIIAPQWVLSSEAFTKFVEKNREDGGYVTVNFTGTPGGCIPTPGHPCK